MRFRVIERALPNTGTRCANSKEVKAYLSDAIGTPNYDWAADIAICVVRQAAVDSKSIHVVIQTKRDSDSDDKWRDYFSYFLTTKGLL